MNEINRQNESEIYEQLRQFYITEIENFSQSVGGPYRAAKILSVARTFFEKTNERTLSSLKRYYDTFAHLDYDPGKIITLDELMSETGFSKNKISGYVVKGTFKRIGQGRYDRESAQVFINDLKERKRICGFT
jgi:ribosomal protein S17E